MSLLVLFNQVQQNVWRFSVEDANSVLDSHFLLAPIGSGPTIVGSWVTNEIKVSKHLDIQEQSRASLILGQRDNQNFIQDGSRVTKITDYSSYTINT